ncbi:hypothetical protein DMENIID0001_065400 [Sergentomyia squamirostris]
METRYFVVQPNSEDNDCYFPSFRLVNIPDELQQQPRLILTEPMVADGQMQYVYQRQNPSPQIAQPQHTQYILQDEDIVSDSYTSQQIYVQADTSGEMIQRQIQHANIVQQQNQEPQQQQVIFQQPPQQTNRVILQASPNQQVLVPQNPVVVNNRPQAAIQQTQQRQIIFDSSGHQRQIFTLATPTQSQLQVQQRQQQQQQQALLQQNLIVRSQPQAQVRHIVGQVRMSTPMSYQARATRPTQTRAAAPQPRIAAPKRYRAPAQPRSQATAVSAARAATRPVRYAPVTVTPPTPRQTRPVAMVRLPQAEVRASSFTGMPRLVAPPAPKVNRSFPPAVPSKVQPAPTSKLEVKNYVPNSQSSTDSNVDLEESISASILEKSQITHTTTESPTKSEDFSSTDESYISNGSAGDMKRKVTRVVDPAQKNRSRPQYAARSPIKKQVNQSVQDLFNSVSSDVEQSSSQAPMLLTQSNADCETRESAKMLVILPCGEQRLITFTLPKESCTVQELLEQVGVPFTPDTNIQCVSNPGANIDYVVTVGDPAQETVSNEIIMEQQQPQPVQPQPQPPPPPPAPQFQATPPPLRTPVRPAVPQFATSTPINQRPPILQQPTLTPITQTPTPTPPPLEPPKPVTVEPKIIKGFLALCKYCGFCGIDHAKCERCAQIFGENPKRIPCEPKTTPPPPPVKQLPVPPLAVAQPSGRVTKPPVRFAKDPVPTVTKKMEVMSKKTFQELSKSFTTVSTSMTNTLVTTVSAPGPSLILAKSLEKPPPPKLTERGAGKGRGGANARPSRARAPKQETPETIILTLSSDDEDDDKSSKQEKSKKTIKPKFEELKPLACEPVISETDSPIKSTERLCITDLSSVQEKLLTSIQCRTIRIGTLQYEPKEQVIFSSLGVRIIAPNVKNTKENMILDVQIREIVKIIAHFAKPLPILFIYTTPACAEYIRTCLDMASNATSGPYFDSCSKHQSVRRITILAEVITDETKSVIKSLYTKAQLEDISYKDANELYKRSQMKLTFSSNPSTSTVDDGSSADMEDVHQILIYPQGKGGISINTEDYSCLAIDQYLNDVIIDFYLNYLRVAVFTEEQRRRTHIFSSFFYNRLTAMSKQQRQMEKDLKMTASQKRHHRVKGWTKNVNLFEKDFIIIPINEQSHWFLAIICFPGLKGPQTYHDGIPVKLAPQVKKKSDGEKKISVTIGNTTITPLTKKEESIFLNDDSMSERDEAEADESEMESEDSEPEVDQSHQPVKQPCILIFDSLAGGYRSRVVATLRDYLTCEYKAKILETSTHSFNKDNMPGHNVKVPQQNNFTDCGLYLLQYVEEFFSTPIRDYRLPIKHLVNWFSTIVVTRKREDISNLLIELVKEQHPDRLSLLPEITFPTQDGKLIETEENFEETPEFEEEELDDPSFDMEDEEANMTEEESPKKNGKKLLKRSLVKTDKISPDKKIPRSN